MIEEEIGSSMRRKNPLWLRVLVTGIFCLSCIVWVYAAATGELGGINAIAALSLPYIAFGCVRTFGGQYERKPHFFRSSKQS